MVEIFKNPLSQFETAAGVPLSGGTLEFFVATTTTPVTVYQDYALATPWGTSVTADSSGLFPAIYINTTTTPSYKIVLKNSGGAIIKTVDNITASGSGASTSFADDVFRITDNIDPTKAIAFQASGITSGQTRTLTSPNASGTLALTTDITTAVAAARDRRNLFENPALQISTVNGNTAGTTNGYEIADGWKVYRVTSAGTITAQRVQSTTPKGAPDRGRITITVADASLAAGEYLIATKTITGREVAHLKYGTAGALQTNFRILVNFPAGTRSYSIQNTAANRSYVGLFTPAVPNTDEIITANIPGDQSGTWPIDTSQWTFNIVLAAGSTFQGTTGWQAGNILGTSAVTNGMGTGSAVFEFGETGWYADPESTGVAPVWELPSYKIDQLVTGGGSGLAQLTSGTVSAVAQLDIVLTNYTGYKGFLFVLREFIPSTDNTDLWMRLSTNGGGSFDAGGSDYTTRSPESAPSTGAQFVIVGSVGNQAAEGADTEVRIANAGTAAQKTRMQSMSTAYRADDGSPVGAHVYGYRNTAQDTDAVRFLFSSGNIASGKYALYGYV